MRLTQSIRKEITSNIRREIPTIDYQPKIEKLIKEDAFKQLPKPLQQLINKDKDILTYLATRYMFGYSCGVSNTHYKMGEKLKDQVKEMQELKSEQTKSINQVMNKITECLNECTTSKRFIEFFPEFEKHMPYPEIAISNLPGNSIMKDLATLGYGANKKSTK